MKKNLLIVAVVATGLFSFHSLLGQGSTPTPTPPAFRGNKAAGPSGPRTPGKIYVTGTGTYLVTVTGSTGLGVSLTGTAPTFIKLTDTNGFYNY